MAQFILERSHFYIIMTLVLIIFCIGILLSFSNIFFIRHIRTINDLQRYRKCINRLTSVYLLTIFATLVILFYIIFTTGNMEDNFSQIIHPETG